MRVSLVDPSAFTPPYDHALARALAEAGLDVELITSRFPHGPVPEREGYEVRELFYRAAARVPARSRFRAPVKLAGHVPGMLRLRAAARDADVVHFQWLDVPQVDVALLPPRRPRVLTAHDVLPREPRRGQLAATRRLLRAMDAVVVHSEHGAARLRGEVGLEDARVHVIPHGVFDYLTRLPEERQLPAELERLEGPVVLFFGLLRPYKGLDVLLEAFRKIEGAELWIVGMPRMPLEPLRELARRARATVRFLPRFITDPEIPAFMRRADIVVLPYREIDQSGVLYASLAFAKPLVLSAVGGFVEVGERHGAAELVPPGEPDALAAALSRLLEDAERRRRLSEAAARAAAGAYSWEAIGQRTADLYRALVAGQAARAPR